MPLLVLLFPVRDEGTPSLPSFSPNSILALENELFVASPLMPNFTGTGAMEESMAAIVAAFLRCDEECGIAQPGLCPPCFQYFGCGLLPLGLTHRWLLRLILPSKSLLLASPMSLISWARWDLLDFWNGVLVFSFHVV